MVLEDKKWYQTVRLVLSKIQVVPLTANTVYHARLILAESLLLHLAIRYTEHNLAIGIK